MSRFVLDSNSLFIVGTSADILQVVETGSNLSAPGASASGWSVVAAAKLGSSYGTIPGHAKLFEQLQVFGVVIGGPLLAKLCLELSSSQVMVNREGYQVLHRNHDGSLDFQLRNCKMFRLNNMFGWREYGVEPKITTVWNRHDQNREAVIDYREMKTRLGEKDEEIERLRAHLAVEEMVTKCLKKFLKDKDEEIEDLGMKLAAREKQVNDFKGAVNRFMRC
ncbi:hypothetical protein LINGRAHAP2_LOCUS16370 [Linum grandiflorum]